MISYQQLLGDAMLSVVKKVLKQIAQEGLDNNQSLYISFKTSDKDVKLSERIKQKYLDEITIVLQYQFKNLIVEENKFTVNIAFSGINETIEVPFSSVTSFIDPHSSFSLQFNQPTDKNKVIDSSEELSKSENTINISEISTNKDKNKKSTDKGQIVLIDKFRSKNSNG